MPALVYIFFQISSQANGGVNSLVEIMEGFAADRPLAITQVENPVNDQLRARGVEVRVAPEGVAGSGVLPKIRFSRWLAKELADYPVAVIHTNDISALLHVLPLLFLRSWPVLHNVRSMYPPGRKYGWHWAALGWCKRIVSLSREMESGLRLRLPIPRHLRNVARFTYVYSIVDFSRFYPVSDQKERRALRLRLGLPPEEILVAYVAKFAPVKQQLAYLNHLRGTAVSFRTLFIGDYRPEEDTYAQRCAAVLESLPETAYSVVGYTERVEDYYRAADVVVVPTAREGMARCMIEGLACGLPVVSFDVCSAREILEGNECGIVIEQGDYAGLTAALKELAGDPARRKVLGGRGVATARENFAKEKAIATYAQLYRELTEGNV